MATEHHKPGRDNGIQYGLSPIAQAVVRTSKEHFNTDYGPHADWLGVGGADPHHPHVCEEVEHGQ